MSEENFQRAEGKVQISHEQIQARVKELGKQISKDYQGQDIHVICVLNGAFLFMADLVRAIDLPLTVDFISLSSYGSRTQTSGEVQIQKDLNFSLKHKNVLIVEDIVDTGYTMSYLLKYIEMREPDTVKIASLISKPSRREVDVEIDYLGFEIEDAFIFGYGLDDQQYKRNYPFISSYKD